MATQIQEESVMEKERLCMATQIQEESVMEEKRVKNAVNTVVAEDDEELPMEEESVFIAPQIQEESVMEERRVGNAKNIVVAVNESDESMRACKWACQHLSAVHTNMGQPNNFTLLYVQPPVCVSAGPAYIFSSDVVLLMEYDEVRTTQKILKRALDICAYYNVKAKTRVVIGKAEEKICEAAQKLGAHFIVMGSRGHGPFIRAIIGSVSDYCSRNAVCPVVVVNKKVV